MENGHRPLTGNAVVFELGGLFRDLGSTASWEDVLQGGDAYCRFLFLPRVR